MKFQQLRSDLLFHSPQHWNWRWCTKVKSQYWQLLVSDTCQNVIRNLWKEIRCQKAHQNSLGLYFIFFFSFSYFMIHKSQKLYTCENRVAATCQHFLSGRKLGRVKPWSPAWAGSRGCAVSRMGITCIGQWKGTNLCLTWWGWLRLQKSGQINSLTQHPRPAVAAASPWGVLHTYFPWVQVHTTNPSSFFFKSKLLFLFKGPREYQTHWSKTIKTFKKNQSHQLSQANMLKNIFS